MTSAADLFGLQEIDLSRDTRRSLIADIDSRLGEAEEVVAARESIETTRAELAAVQRHQRDVDGQLEDLDARLHAAEQKLYSGAVRNPKELTDLQREVNIIKGKRSKLDDDGLETMDRLEEATKALKAAESQLQEVEATWRADQQELVEERERAEKDIQRLEEERQRRVATMEPRALAVYESLRTTRAGRAVARVERNTCTACRLGLPTHIAQRVRSASELVQCPSCERILVIG